MYVDENLHNNDDKKITFIPVLNKLDTLLTEDLQKIYTSTINNTCHINKKNITNNMTGSEIIEITTTQLEKKTNELNKLLKKSIDTFDDSDTDTDDSNSSSPITSPINSCAKINEQEQQDTHKMMTTLEDKCASQEIIKEEFEHDEYFYVKLNVDVDIEKDWLEINISDIVS
jgi:hypothetical protein